MSRAVIIGEKELNRAINKLPTYVAQRKFWMSAARAAAKPVKKQIEKNISAHKFSDRSLGDLEMSIRFRSFSRKTFMFGGFLKAGHRTDSNTMTNPAKMAIMVHNRKTNPINKTLKNPFEGAAESKGAEALGILLKKGSTFIERIWKRL